MASQLPVAVPLRLGTPATDVGDRFDVCKQRPREDMTTALGPKHIFLNDVNMTEQKGMTVLL
jgi:hypothetical protein